MAEAHSFSPTRARLAGAGRLLAWAVIGALGLMVALQLVFFVTHAAHVLSYPYPLDYGEGPLLTQVELLRAGTPIWQLYASPDAPPYAVVNYPPLYQLIALAVALPLGNALLAGRLVSLAAALAALAALWLLAGVGPWALGRGDHSVAHRPWSSFLARLVLVLAFLALPIVREWSVLMRVDMLGVSLGLWGLVLVQRLYGRRAVLWAALPLTLCLLVKPSLIAAPAAALLWLLFRDWRRALLLGVLIGLGGALVAALLQLGSGGWFLLHVLNANANAWQRPLAYGFWHDQLLILWPLVAAGALAAGLAFKPSGAILPACDPRLLLALSYTLFGAIVAYGVGKVGAYANYFLDFYAGLIWLAAAYVGGGAWQLSLARASQAPPTQRQQSLGAAIVSALVMAALLRYYPTWSENYLKLAGIIEGRNPPRLIVGGYGVWRDLRREREILATLAGVNADLVGEVRAADEPIFTDIPGVAAQAGQLSLVQAFEYRQLLDAGLADQSGLLRSLANGRAPLIVLDYLGNWLTPEMIAMITHRYAQDGSRGTYDLYRPVDPGPQHPASLALPGHVQLVGYHLAPSPSGAAYQAGETALLTLDLRSDAPSQGQPPAAEPAIDVLVQLSDTAGQVLLEDSRPLLYGALPPARWGGELVQHMQPIGLPPDLPAGRYQLRLALHIAGGAASAAQPLAELVVEQGEGRIVGEGGYFVPAPLLAAWQRLGGDTGPGDALMPAVPFAGATLQCFARACLRLAGGQTEQLPLGELVHLADVGLLPAQAGAGSPGPHPRLAEPFLSYWREHGGEASLGPPITPELIRADRIVQYTRYARLERPASGGSVRLGRLGEDYLRLPGGVAYRWP